MGDHGPCSKYRLPSILLALITSDFVQSRQRRVSLRLPDRLRWPALRAGEGRPAGPKETSTRTVLTDRHAIYLVCAAVFTARTTGCPRTPVFAFLRAGAVSRDLFLEMALKRRSGPSCFRIVHICRTDCGLLFNAVVAFCQARFESPCTTRPCQNGGTSPRRDCHSAALYLHQAFQ